MGFHSEDSATQVWPTMQAEHDLLVNAIKLAPHRGFLPYLNHRFVDPERQVALYYVFAYGMGQLGV